jgi:hypothetical protein
MPFKTFTKIVLFAKKLLILNSNQIFENNCKDIFFKNLNKLWILDNFI